MKLSNTIALFHEAVSWSYLPLLSCKRNTTPSSGEAGMGSPKKKICGGGLQYCVVCKNYRGKVIDGRVVKLHTLPKNKIIRTAWERRLRLVRKDYNTVKYPVLCSEHFVGKKGPSTGDDVPSIFPSRIFKQSSVTEIPCGEENGRALLGSQEDERLSFPTSESALNEDQATAKQADFALPAFSVLLHDYCGQVNVETIFKPTHQTVLCSTDTTFENAVTQTQTIIGECVFGKHSGTQTDFEFESDFTPLRYEHIISNDKTVRLYTGLKDSQTMSALFDEIPPIEERDNASGTNSLRHMDQFLMTLMRLKLGLVLEDLCFRFSVSKATCSRIVNKWINHLYIHLSFLVYWPTRGQINATMPADFRKSFPRTRVVIDCTELFTETPQSLADRSLMYSHYKSHMTWKALVGITPNGVVSFVSDLWSGSISDKQIVQKSGILDKCERGDAIMGDKGFLISDLTTPKGLELIVPPRKEKRNQMRTKDILLTRRIANVRIHVERHMERVKNFKVLHNLTGSMKANVSKIWRICNYLTALQSPLHPHECNDEDDPDLC